MIATAFVALAGFSVASVRRYKRQAEEATGVARKTIEQEVVRYAGEIEHAVARFRIFVETTDAIAFEYDIGSKRLVYITPQVTRLLGSTSNRTRREFLGTLIHPDDRARVTDAVSAYAARPTTERVAIQYRLVRDDGRIVHVRTLLSDHTHDGLVRGITFDITAQVKLETEVRQAQKLESVGRLAAGVAHEINTPVQYVQDSVQFVREAVGDVFAVLARHRELTSHVAEGNAERDAAVAALTGDDEADLDYLIEHVPQALDRASEGLARVTTIVHSLKAFAHSDQRQRSEIDINAAIETTLEVARNEYKYVADVELDLHELPRVDCFAGEINQVLLNLVVNAAHAIQDGRRDDERGLIRVRTRHPGDHVEISIGDTGCGIPDHVRDRIFEPFFTTKEVGRGTGQGLSIARSVIVDKHAGSLTFESTVGHGTTFTIQLPVTTSIGAAA